MMAPLLHPLDELELERLRRGFAALTPRERQILERIVNAESTLKIAYDLEIATRTVELHRQNVLQKMRAINTPDLVRRVALLENAERPRRSGTDD
ncbi:MAG TPA: LuxR C-terminal-related transcriptional regulator [Devosia sp.]|jgi:two-component system response regulator FixJ|nr:LuxR C-terminal-related transcriptional regulator [Devosia sp.]